MNGFRLHQIIEKNNGLLIFGILFVSSIGGLVQVLPSLFQESLATPTANTRPYGAVELVGRDITSVNPAVFVIRSTYVRWWPKCNATDPIRVPANSFMTGHSCGVPNARALTCIGWAAS